MPESDRVHFGESVIRRPRAEQSPSYQHRLSVTEKEAEIASTWSDDACGMEERDFKKKQIFRGWSLFLLAFQSTGVIYGDIGTSPLYVFSSTFTSEPSYDDLLGAVSLIIWSLTLIVTIKYVLIVLSADDEGEGGTFAIYTLLARFSDIMKRDPRSYHTVKMERYLSNQMKPGNRAVRGWLERSRIAHAVLKILAVFGVSLIMADGILTPAQSVLGAIQGIKVIRPDLGTPTIVGVSCAILVLLFAVQPLGIGRLSSGFAPVVVLWLLLNLIFGIYNLAIHDYTVLKAFSPYFAGAYFMRNKTEGWKSLGGILLCFTGVEALFADLGAFSKRAIQISWLCFAYPCLLFAYIGQAAFISRDPSAYSNPFFNTVPPHMFYPSLVISILAAIVASQALITSTFQLLSQIMHSSYFPHIKMIYTSTKYHGQVYIPIANWLMMLGTIIVTAVYHNTTRLGNAYGVCVILVTFITTNLVTLVALIVWRTHPVLVFLIWLPFVTLDALFLSAALVKVPDGAWFTLLLAALLASFFSLWRYGKEKQWTSEARQSIKLNDLIVHYPAKRTPTSTANPQSNIAATSSADQDKQATKTNSRAHQEQEQPNLYLRLPRYSGAPLTPIQGIGIFFDKSGPPTSASPSSSSRSQQTIPHVYANFTEKLTAHFRITIFLHLRPLGVPHVHLEDRCSVSHMSGPKGEKGLEGMYRLVVRYGYNDHVITPDLGRWVYEEVRRYIIADVRSRRGGERETTVEVEGTTTVLRDTVEAGQGTVTSFPPPNITHGINPDTETERNGQQERQREREWNTAGKLQALDDAYDSQTLFLVGKEQLRITAKNKGIGGLMQRAVLNLFLFVRENTRQKVAQLDIPVDRLVEVGFVGLI